MLQNDFDLLSKWSHDASLVLNASKTKLMYISTSQNRSTIVPNLKAHSYKSLHSNQYKSMLSSCDVIELVDKQKHLGLTIENRLNWKAQMK